tara:strand:+ start:1027 stop:1254 length:228 start_codon:yes stop_codon:yes gene_type:complete
MGEVKDDLLLPQNHRGRNYLRPRWPDNQVIPNDPDFNISNIFFQSGSEILYPAHLDSPTALNLSDLDIVTPDYYF